MTKLRFTDCDIWDTPWFMDLAIKNKLMWRYLCDKSDNCGVWLVNRTLATTHLGFTPDLEAALAALTDEVRPIASGKKWHLINFIRFQYPTGLRESVTPHRQVLRLLASHGLTHEGVVGGVPSGPPSGPKDKDQTRPDQTGTSQGEPERGRPSPSWDRPQFVKWLQRRGLETGVIASGQDRTEEWIGLAEECGCCNFAEAKACIESLMRVAKKNGVQEFRYRSKLDPFKAGYIAWKKKRDAEAEANDAQDDEPAVKETA